MEVFGEEGILIGILARLPVGSLLRFKSVCKQWRSIISDADFAKLQLRRSKEQNPTSSSGCRLLLLNSWPESIDYHFLSIDCENLSCFSDQGAGTAIRSIKHLAPRVRRLLSGTDFVGSCDGLICLVKYPEGIFFLWNPATGAYNVLPTHCPPSKRKRHKFFHGFGYDSVMNEYKVVRGALPKYGSEPDDTIIDIFSTKMGYWRRITCGVIAPVTGRAVFLNGSLHWLAKRDDGVHGRIVSLSLGDETFGELKSPVPFDSDPRVTIAEECLSVWECTGIDHDYMFRAWIMRDYAVESSWIEHRSFVIKDYFPYWYSRVPLWIRKDGKVVFASGDLQRPTIIVDPEKGKESDFLQLRYYFFPHYVNHVESLTSPLMTTQDRRRTSRRK